MAVVVRRQVLDDYDGQELPEDTNAFLVAVDRDTWRVYLSDENKQRLMEAIEPFVNGAERANEVPAGAPRRRRSSTSDVDPKAVRTWARENNVTDNDGNPVGDRGRIRPEIVAQYKEAVSK